jgi:hypothetical protein
MEEEYRICFETYEVSNLGNVRRKLLNGEYKILKCSILNRGGGYKYFQTNREKKRINYLVHHLVAKLFIGERPENLVIDHIDRNPMNNNVSNLRYITQKENCCNTDKYREDIEAEGKERNKLISKKYREEHKEELRIKKKIYKDVNKDKIKQAGKLYYEKKKDIIINKAKEYREKNKDVIN